MSDLARRDAITLEEQEALAERRAIAPGRVPSTLRLSRAAQQTIVLRIADAGAARELAGLLGPRDDNGVSAGADAIVRRAARSSGQALPGDVRARFESSTGADLSGVRVHTGADSAAAAAAVGAHAYTVGQDIHFGDGKYAPQDPFGLHLLAHEVAHTVQQAGGPAHRQHKLEVSTPGDAAEVEADRAADAMVRGDSAAMTRGAASSGVARQVLHRAGDKPAAPAGGASSFKFGGEIPLGSAISAGPFTVKFKAKYEASAKAGTDNGAKNSGEAGAKATDDGDVGIAAEVKHEFEKQQLGDLEIKPDFKGLTEVTTKKGKVGFAFSGKAKAGPIDIAAMKAEFDIVKWEVGKPPALAVASLSFDVPFAASEVKTAKGKASVECKLGVSCDIQPDLAKIGEFLLEDLGAAGAVDLAVTLGASIAPLLCLASALQMAADEAELAGKVAEYARDGKRAAVVLATATMGSDMPAATPAQQLALARGKAAAQQASAKCGLDAYKAGWVGDKASLLNGQCDRQARMGYEGKVRAAAEATFEKSFNWKFWKTKEDAVAEAMKVLGTIWP